MNRGHRTIVAGVHGLQHFQHFCATHFPHNNAVRAHAQAVAQQVTNGNHTRAFKATGAAFHAHHMGVRQGQFSRVFNRDHTLIGRDEPRNGVEHGSLAAAGAAADEDIAALTHRQLQQAGHALVHGAELDQILHAQRVIAELADGHCRAIQ